MSLLKSGKPICVLDYETFSECDLKKAGGWEYSVHPSTEILCVAYRIGTWQTLRTAKTRIWIPGISEDAFGDLLRAFRNPDMVLGAHNASFEQMITRNVFATKNMPSKKEELQGNLLPPERWYCTAAAARAIGIPGNLEGAGSAMNLKVQKDPEGKKLVRELCMPRKPTKKDPSTRNRNPERLARLAEYCIQDTDTEVELLLALPELHPSDRKFWCLNQRMNFRGFAVDRKLVTNALKLIAVESNRLDVRTKEITGGKLESARQRNEVLNFTKKNGLKLPDLRGQTVKEFLKNTKPKVGQEKAFELLQIRESIGRSSTAKYAAFEIRSRSDGRARDNALWYGAHTGRDSGGGLQPHNLPSLASPSLRDTGLSQKDVEVGVDLIRAGDRHAIEAMFKKPMDLYASTLRSCIVAGNGKTLEVGDFATIEVRVLFWLANEQFGIKQIIEGRDLYCEMAGKIHGEDSEKIKKAYKAGEKWAALMRQLGKQTVLGGGFGIGLGGEKFMATCQMYGMDISLDIAQSAVRAYRDLYPRVPIFWTNVEAAAIAAVRNPGKRYRIGHLVWGMEGNRLTCQLPVGRKLSYYGARVGQKQTMYGPRACLEYLGVISPSKVFGRIHTWGGKLTENAVQGVARDCLYESLCALEEEKIREPVLAVHDEVVNENKKPDVPSFLNTMGRVPSWAPGLPVKVEGWAERRYRK